MIGAQRHRNRFFLFRVAITKVDMFPVTCQLTLFDRDRRNSTISFGHDQRPAVGSPTDGAYMSHHDGITHVDARHISGQTSLRSVIPMPFTVVENSAVGY